PPPPPPLPRMGAGPPPPPPLSKFGRDWPKPPYGRVPPLSFGRSRTMGGLICTGRSPPPNWRGCIRVASDGDGSPAWVGGRRLAVAANSAVGWRRLIHWRADLPDASAEVSGIAGSIQPAPVAVAASLRSAAPSLRSDHRVTRIRTCIEPSPATLVAIAGVA